MNHSTNTITLFKNTINETTYDLDKDLTLTDYDEQDGDILATFDLYGITLEYISTKQGLTLDTAYVLDGGYNYFDINMLNNHKLNIKVESIILDHIIGL